MAEARDPRLVCAVSALMVCRAGTTDVRSNPATRRARPTPNSFGEACMRLSPTSRSPARYTSSRLTPGATSGSASACPFPFWLARHAARLAAASDAAAEGSSRLDASQSARSFSIVRRAASSARDALSRPGPVAAGGALLGRPLAPPSDARPAGLLPATYARKAVVRASRSASTNAGNCSGGTPTARSSSACRSRQRRGSASRSSAKPPGAGRSTQ